MTDCIFVRQIHVQVYTARYKIKAVSEGHRPRLVQFKNTIMKSTESFSLAKDKLFYH